MLGCSGLRVLACSVPQANFKPDQRCTNDTSKSKISRHDMVKVKVFATRNQLIAVLGQIGQLCLSWIISANALFQNPSILSGLDFPISYTTFQFSEYNNMKVLKGLIRLHQPKPSSNSNCNVTNKARASSRFFYGCTFNILGWIGSHKSQR